MLFLFEKRIDLNFQNTALFVAEEGEVYNVADGVGFHGLAMFSSSPINLFLHPVF